jgi:hypothetical protein
MDDSTEPGPAAASDALAEPDAAEALATGRRFRGKNKNGRWKREEGTEPAVIRLPLDVHPDDEPRLEQLFSTMWDVKRTLQRDARAAVDAYWAGTTRRETDAKAWRRELGLTREGMERRAYAHMERTGWFGHHVSKALVMHQADEVYETSVARHLFPDASGRRHGRPKTGRWWDYTRIPGRARSHTSERTWETFRLHGTLDEHLDAHRHPKLDKTATTPARAALLPAGTSVLAQPWRLKRPDRPAGRIPAGATDAKGRPKTRAATWWDHIGPLTVVFAGGPDSQRGDLVLPVRLPSGAGRWARLVHFLGDPATWHKIDLVRRRDASAPRGWAYEAHLMVLTGGYASPATRVCRAAAAELDRVAGIDGNVSNLSVVSLPGSFDPADGPLTTSRIELTGQELAALARAERRARDRRRALDRSRRATNTRQYGLSKRQHKRAERRAKSGLAERQVTVPGGARAANAAGVPKQAYRKDDLSAGYRLDRAQIAEAAASAAEAKDHRARRIAADIVGAHGAHLVVEDCDIRTWFRLWGKKLQATTPGRLITAIGREAEKTGGRLLRASTCATKLSQTCLCGAEVRKTLADRVHDCPDCGLTGDRDLVSALLAALVRLTDPDDPATARLDTVLARNTQILFASGLQEALSSQPQRGAHPARGRTHAAARHPLRERRAPARRNAIHQHQPTPDETRPANMRHKAHVRETDSAKVAHARQRELVGRHPLLTG